MFLAQFGPGSVDQLHNKDDHKDSPPYPLSRRGMGSWLSLVLVPLMRSTVKSTRTLAPTTGLSPRVT
jgi:hypothetical protein